MSLAAGDCYRLYAATRRALQRVVLEKNERRLMDVVLDCSYGWGIPWLRLTGKKDLETLTGILIKNQERTFEALKRMRMLDVRCAAPGLVLEALPDVRGWIVTHRIDEGVYYCALSGLRHFNGLDQLELLPQEKTLNEELGEIARQNAVLAARATEPAARDDRNLPAQGGAEDTTAKPPCQVLPTADGDPEAEGSNRESARENATRTGGPQGPLRVWEKMVETGFDPEQVRNALKSGIGHAAPPMTNGTHGEYQQRGKPPDAGGEVLTVSTSGTHGEYLDGKNGRGKAGKPPNGTHGEYLGVRARAPLMFNASSKKHYPLPLMELAAKAREGYFERCAGKAKLLHYLELAGVFAGKQGEHFRQFWWDQVEHNTTVVERWFFDMLCKVKEDGPKSIKSAGAYMVAQMKISGQIRYRRREA